MEPERLQIRLKSARVSRGLSLRDVEKLSDGKISNPYISQLETGNPRVLEVSTTKLRILSRIYKIDYLELMILANHITIRDLKGRV